MDRLTGTGKVHGDIRHRPTYDDLTPWPPCLGTARWTYGHEAKSGGWFTTPSLMDATRAGRRQRKGGGERSPRRTRASRLASEATRGEEEKGRPEGFPVRSCLVLGLCTRENPSGSRGRQREFLGRWKWLLRRRHPFEGRIGQAPRRSSRGVLHTRIKKRFLKHSECFFHRQVKSLLGAGRVGSAFETISASARAGSSRDLHWPAGGLPRRTA